MKKEMNKTNLFLATASRFLVYFGTVLFFLGLFGTEFAARLTTNPVAGGVDRVGWNFYGWVEQNDASVETFGKSISVFNAVSVFVWILLVCLSILVVFYTFGLFVRSRQLAVYATLGGALVFVLSVVWWIIAIVFSVTNGNSETTVVLSGGAYLIVSGPALTGIFSILTMKKAAFSKDVK